MDVVKEWADMVHCRPVDLGNSFAKRLKALESKIREDSIPRRGLIDLLREDIEGMDKAAREAMADNDIPRAQQCRAVASAFQALAQEIETIQFSVLGSSND